MLTRKSPGGYLEVRAERVPSASLELEELGASVVRGAFDAPAIGTLRAAIEGVYDRWEADSRDIEKKTKVAEDFRYEMFNRNALCQSFVSRREILDVIEPLLGEDCHVIANTCWRNLPMTDSTHGGGAWHIDAGPHIPLGEGQTWPSNIPHPVFAVGVHVFLEDCPLSSGPTAFIPGSHKSGRYPPQQNVMDINLTWNDSGAVPLTAEAGDVAFFVSDVWHRRLPPAETNSGRFFLQIHYGRRDIAQRIKPTHERNHVDADATARIASDREKLVLGLHARGFYDG